MPSRRSVALVTGATGDLGQAISVSLCEMGYFVLATGRDNEKGQRLTSSLGRENACFVKADVTCESDIVSLFDHSCLNDGNLSVVVTCAGILDMCPTADVSRDKWEHILATNLTGTFLVVRHALEVMRANRSGIVIAIGSRWGKSGASRAAAYSATKAGLRALVKSLQIELIGSGVRVMLVSPGSVSSRMSASVDASSRNHLLAPSAVADLVCFLAKTQENVGFDEITIKSYPYDYEH